MKAWLEQLHSGAEWYHISPAARTPLQRLAARTLGVATPGNVITLAGLGLTLYGLAALIQQNNLGVLWILIGRLLDVLDGLLARLTRTSSPFGEGLDATCDKVAIIITASMLMVASVASILLLPLALILAAILLEEACTALIILQARRKDIQIHPTRLGKYTTFALWFFVIAYLSSYILNPLDGANAGQSAAVLVAIIALGFVVLALRWLNFIRITGVIQKERKKRETLLS
ncbi:MAG TPA: CDP-alcohol phosphatidyltransferase family protein [Candidatus Saccharimonadales bacterium]